MRSSALRLLLPLSLLALAVLGVSGASIVFDVSNYGAVGDGHTDDSAAVAKAVADLNQARGEVDVVLSFPFGVYLLASEVQGAYIDITYTGGAITIQTAQSPFNDSVATLLYDTNIANCVSITNPAAASDAGAAASSALASGAASSSIAAAASGSTFPVSITLLAFSALPVNVSLPYFSAIYLATAAEVSVAEVDFVSQVGAYGITVSPPPAVASSPISLHDLTFQNGGTFVTILPGLVSVSISDCMVNASTILQAEEQLPLGVDVQGSGAVVTVERSTFINCTNAINLSGGGVGKSLSVNDCAFIDPINAGINIADNTTVNVINSRFNSTVPAQIYNRNIGIAIMYPQYLSSDADSASLTVAGCEFIDVINGVGAHTGQVSIDQSRFERNSDIGVVFVMDDDRRRSSQKHSESVSSLFCPFNCTNSLFLNNGNDHLTAMANMIIVQNNSCEGAGAAMETECDFVCVMKNNQGCVVNPLKQMQEEKKGKKDKIVLVEQ